MASYPGASYLQGQQLPGPPPGPPPGPSRQASHTTQYSSNSYGAPSPYQQGPGQTSAPTSAPQPFPQFQQQLSSQHLPTIHQHRPLSNSQMRAHSYSQPKPYSQPQQIPQGLYPPQPQGYLYPQHASAPNQSWMQGGYPFGEPGYSTHPGMDPRRYSASSHHSGRSTASYHSGHSKGRKSRYSDESGVSDDEHWDSMYDSEEEERRRRKKERRKRREEAAAEKSKNKRDRPTVGDSVFAVFDSFKDAFSSSGGKH